MRAEIVGVLSGTKPPKPNLTKQEQQALKQLKKEKSITIVPADKGRSTVVLDSSSYDEKVNLMLSNHKTYEQLATDPTNKYKRELMSTLGRLKDESKITTQQYEYLRPSGESIPRLYATPKIHKPNVPLRPIVDYTGSIAYNVSRSLADSCSFGGKHQSPCQKLTTTGSRPR